MHILLQIFNVQVPVEVPAHGHHCGDADRVLVPGGDAASDGDIVAKHPGGQAGAQVDCDQCALPWTQL